MHKRGSVPGVIYFINHTDPSQREGYMMLAPLSDMATPTGWSRHETHTLREGYELQARLQEQEFIDWKREASRDLQLLEARFQRSHDRFVEKMTSSSTSAWERDAIAAYLKLQEDKLEKHEKNLQCGIAYLRSLEFDLPKGRRDDEESVNLDRLG